MTLPRDYDTWQLRGPDEPDDSSYTCTDCNEYAGDVGVDKRCTNCGSGRIVPSDEYENERGDYLYERMRDRRDGL